MRNFIFCCWILGMSVWVSSCNLTYHSTYHAITFSDSINLTRNYTMYVRKLAYDMKKDAIVRMNVPEIDTTRYKTIEMEYLFFNPDMDRSILISYLPSYYYADAKKGKGGLYAEIISDSTLYVHQIRRITVMKHSKERKLTSGDYVYDYELYSNNDGRKRINLTHAIHQNFTYLIGRIHLDEAVKNTLLFEDRKGFQVTQHIQDSLHSANYGLQRFTAQKRGVQEIQNQITLYVTNKGKKKGIVFIMPDGKKIVFGKSRTNWFSVTP